MIVDSRRGTWLCSIGQYSLEADVEIVIANPGAGILYYCSFLSYFEKNSSLVGVKFGLCIYVSMYVCMYVCMYVSFYVLGYVTPIRLRLLCCPGK